MSGAPFPVDRPRPRDEQDPSRAEQALLIRVVDALYREDHLAMSSASQPSAPPRGLPARLRAPTTGWRVCPLPLGRRVLVPMRPDGFLADHRLAAPLLVVESADLSTGTATRLAEVLDALAPEGDPVAAMGWAAFTDECRQALAVLDRARRVDPARSDVAR